MDRLYVKKPEPIPTSTNQTAFTLRWKAGIPQSLNEQCPPTCTLLVLVTIQKNLSLHAASLFRRLCTPLSSKDSSPRGILA